MSKKTEKETQQLSRAHQLLQDKRFAPFAKETVEWEMDWGILPLDLTLKKIRPGIIRLWGSEGKGKTAVSLHIASQHQQTFPDESFVVYVNSEMRLSQKLVEMSSIDISPDKFLKFDCNISETVFEYFRELITDNPEQKKYCFIIDSLDNLSSKMDFEKNFSEHDKVASSATLNTSFTKKTSLPLTKNGHLLILISQIRTDLSTVGSHTGVKTKASGGNALNHASNVTLEFLERYNSDIIYEYPNAATLKERGKPLGHYCKLRIRKAQEEVVGQEISYPVKYGRKNGNSVWREYMVWDLIRSFDFVNKKGGWFSFAEEIQKELKEANLEFQEKIQGELGFIEYLENSPHLVKFFEDKFEKLK